MSSKLSWHRKRYHTLCEYRCLKAPASRLSMADELDVCMWISCIYSSVLIINPHTFPSFCIYYNCFFATDALCDSFVWFLLELHYVVLRMPVAVVSVIGCIIAPYADYFAGNRLFMCSAGFVWQKAPHSGDSYKIQLWWKRCFKSFDRTIHLHLSEIEANNATFQISTILCCLIILLSSSSSSIMCTAVVPMDPSHRPGPCYASDT